MASGGAVIESNGKTVKAFIKDLNYINSRLTPAATAKALTRTMVTAKANVTRYARDNARLMYEYKGVRRVFGLAGDPTGKLTQALKLQHVAKRVYTKSATLARPVARLRGYTQDMPAIRVAEKASGVKRLAKVSRRKTKMRGEQYGVRVGRRNFSGAFLQQASTNQRWQLFTRLQKPTWQPGHSGWKDWRAGSPTRNVHREPYAVLKYDLKTPFAKTYEIIDRVFAEKYAKEFEHHFSYYAARALVKSGAVKGV